MSNTFDPKQLQSNIIGIKNQPNVPFFPDRNLRQLIINSAVLSKEIRSYIPKLPYINEKQSFTRDHSAIESKVDELAGLFHCVSLSPEYTAASAGHTRDYAESFLNSRLPSFLKPLDEGKTMDEGAFIGNFRRASYMRSKIFWPDIDLPRGIRYSLLEDCYANRDAVGEHENTANELCNPDRESVISMRMTIDGILRAFFDLKHTHNHEETHADQSLLGRAFAQGQITQNSPFYRDGFIFHCFSERIVDYTSQITPLYDANILERDAERSGALFSWLASGIPVGDLSVETPDSVPPARTFTPLAEARFC